jgi:hypothetical protein
VLAPAPSVIATKFRRPPASTTAIIPVEAAALVDVPEPATSAEVASAGVAPILVPVAA